MKSKEVRIKQFKFEWIPSSICLRLDEGIILDNRNKKSRFHAVTITTAIANQNDSCDHNYDDYNDNISPFPFAL